MKLEVHWEYFPETTATPRCCLSGCWASMRTLGRNLEGNKTFYSQTHLSPSQSLGNPRAQVQRPSGHILAAGTGCAPVLQASKSWESSCLGNPEGMKFGLWSPLLGWAWIHPLFHGRTAAGDTREGCRRREKLIFLQDGAEGFLVKQMFLQWLLCTDIITYQHVKANRFNEAKWWPIHSKRQQGKFLTSPT